MIGGSFIDSFKKRCISWETTIVMTMTTYPDSSLYRTEILRKSLWSNLSEQYSRFVVISLLLVFQPSGLLWSHFTALNARFLGLVDWDLHLTLGLLLYVVRVLVLRSCFAELKVTVWSVWRLFSDIQGQLIEYLVADSLSYCFRNTPIGSQVCNFFYVTFHFATEHNFELWKLPNI